MQSIKKWARGIINQLLVDYHYRCAKCGGRMARVHGWRDKKECMGCHDIIILRGF